MENIKLGISTCPNDTFIFGAMIRKDIDVPFNIRVIMDDIQLCNELAINKKLDIVKVSFGVFNEIKNDYKILKCGGALGFGCGPLILSKKYSSMDELKGKKIAIPGRNTTAFMVFKRFFPECAANTVEMRFDTIMESISKGETDAGLVIHEGRFTYKNFGLSKITDIGSEWESRYNLPIPLGFIAIKKDMAHIADTVNDAIKRSIDFAYDNLEISYSFAEKYAQDMDKDVMASHIKLYVNEYSKDMSPAIDAISELLNVDDSVFA